MAKAAAIAKHRRSFFNFSFLKIKSCKKDFFASMCE